jgi:N-acyl-D-aspartate/D-glutamate deacylase
MAFDVVIRNGWVVDGTGRPGEMGDVAIRDGRIVEVGAVDGGGAQEIDAEGHAVTPGFIDGHTHMDAQVFWDALGTCSCWHGVTTVVMGNCGFSLAPAPVEQRALVVRNLERAEDISGDAMAAAIDWSWDDFPSYLDAIERLPKGINYVAQVGHSALRTYAMGERAFSDAATEDDIEAMRRALADGLRAGAGGFTTSRTANHATSDNRPVASRLAHWTEVEALVGVLGEQRQGVLEMAVEDDVYGRDPESRREARDRLRHLAVDSGVPVTFGLLPGRDELILREMIEMIERTKAEGGQMLGQTHSRGISIMIGFQTRLPFDRLPEWREMRALALPQQREMLLDQVVRQRLVDAASSGQYARAVGAELRPPRFDRIEVLWDTVNPNPTIEELAAERRQNPVDVMIDIALDSNFETWFAQYPTPRVSDESRQAVLRHPNAVMTFSDSGAHVSQIMDASIQAHFLAYWVRERQVLSFEQAVHQLTGRAASWWQLQDRGVIRPGAVADVNVIDPTTIAPLQPKVVNDLPTGARRLVQKSTGIKTTLVAGQPLFVEGEHTGALPGRLLRASPVPS